MQESTADEVVFVAAGAVVQFQSHEVARQGELVGMLLADLI